MSMQEMQPSDPANLRCRRARIHAKPSPWYTEPRRQISPAAEQVEFWFLFEANALVREDDLSFRLTLQVLRHKKLMETLASVHGICRRCGDNTWFGTCWSSSGIADIGWEQRWICICRCSWRILVNASRTHIWWCEHRNDILLCISDDGL